ncbi:MAG: transposase [Novosphingobium sp.]|nr:transposase [Novosphingobium sp.]MCP5403225.1 transposase [Novosphingobium sp.]
MHQSLQQRGITACIPAQRQRRHLPDCDPIIYRQRDRIENMFVKLKDWRRIHTRYDRCADLFPAPHHTRRNLYLLDQSMRPDPRRDRAASG